ncbi:MAG: selenium metabolism-associated LysR family transcriptional regulator [Candidatus Limiplasma sp.]|nr:selenium metabolism-associated LysR family transcriptional regulator [Candidatus Limiplasma sp.]
MEIKQLEVFACVAQTLNFSKAAEMLHISQPTVSAGVRSLEKDLGAQLLIRNTKEVALTKAGLELLAYAQKILALREEALHSLGGQDTQMQGAMDILASTIPAQHLLPEIIAAFQRQWPNILFRVQQADSRQVEREMGGFRYDFGLVGTVPQDQSLIHCPVFEDELVLVIPSDAPESPREIRENFAAYVTSAPFLMREAGSGTRIEMEGILTKVGVNPGDLQVRAYFSDAHGILGAISHGMGISLISKVAAALYVEQGLVRAVEMDGPLFRRQIHLLYNKERWLSPMQKAFARHVERFYRGGPQQE